MRQLQKITILIPCHNEERGIGSVIDGIPLRLLKRLGYKTEIIVINNNSTDRTAHIAEKRGAKVIVETKKGKGHAIKSGFKAVSDETVFVIMLDGDNTYKTKEIIRLIEPLMTNFCDVVIGSRLGGKMKKNSFKLQNRIVNWAYTFLVRQFYRTNITDVLSGYFAWRKDVLDRLLPHLESEGFEIEMEMITKMEKLGFEVYSVPITYDEREGQTKIEAIKDGIKILSMFFKNLNWSPDPRSAKSLHIESVKTN
jgi:dolichol-phosphate hexosyltransferase